MVGLSESIGNASRRVLNLHIVLANVNIYVINVIDSV